MPITLINPRVRLTGPNLFEFTHIAIETSEIGIAISQFALECQGDALR